MILQNAVHDIVNDKYYISTHVHDYVGFEINGKSYFIDGGHDYLRRNYFSTIHGNVLEDYALYDDDPIEEIKKKLLWGSRGKAGDEPLTYRPLRLLETDHLQAILRTQPNINTFTTTVIHSVLKERGEK